VSDETRDRIVDVAAQLMQQRGPSGVTTRGVAQGAGVQAPTIYRLFGDKDGLLEAVAEHVMSTFVAAKSAIVEDASANGVDPLEDLRDGWRTHIDFGVANPAVFRLLSDPARVLGSPAAELGRGVLEARVHRVAETGRLRVSERRAVDAIQAAGVGAINVILSTPPERRDPDFADELFAAVLAQILTDAPPADESGAKATAVALRALTPRLDMLSHAERRVLDEWLDRAIAAL
jgi:AcrR family transcriptional regulator